MLGAAAAALAVRRPTGELAGALIDRAPSDGDDPPRSTWTGATRWIGHC
jgi:hypothetical protein